MGQRLKRLLRRIGAKACRIESQDRHLPPMEWPPGHYYSPIVDPEELRRYRAVHPTANLSEIDLRVDQQWAVFKELAASFDKLDIVEAPTPGHRYYRGGQNWFFDYGDAACLGALLLRHNPKHLIEVGSGFSSAAALDAIDRFQLDTKCTFIDPDPSRLRALCTADDLARHEVFESFVQQLPVETFRKLSAADILFIDSSHVVKSGSDVLFLLFEVLPLLPAGVLIHFHDVFDNFEYPDHWLYSENRSWNELYVLRGFLANNSKYRIHLMVDLIVKRFGNDLMKIDARFRMHPGGSLWLIKQ